MTQGVPIPNERSVRRPWMTIYRNTVPALDQGHRTLRMLWRATVHCIMSTVGPVPKSSLSSAPVVS